jgi:transposase
MVHDLRAMCDAVSYVVKNGVEWRTLPVDFPPWEAVYAFFERWNGRGLPRPHRPALLPGAAAPLGCGAHVRLADALPPPGP